MHTLSLLISDREKNLSDESYSALDWETLTHQAHAEGVGPLLYWKLSKSERFSSLPEGTRNFLRLLYASAKIQNRIIFKELKGLARCFHQAGIDVVALKGVCFALTVYPDVGLRPMGDMDLLVHKARLGEALDDVVDDGP